MAKTAVLNFSDIPEMLPGARPGANPAQREQFERLSRRLHEEEVEERAWERHASQVLSGVGSTGNELEGMFPTLDPALVKMLCAEAPSIEHAMETLLALSAATTDSGNGEGGVDLPLRDVGIQDHNKFPSLIDADGWEVPAARLLSDDEDLGSGWRDRVKAVADKPAPKASSRPPVVWGAKKKQGKQKDANPDEQVLPLTDYDCRHKAGQQRAQQRVQYGRGHGADCRGKGGDRDAGRDGEAGVKDEHEEESIDLSTL